MGQDMKFTTGAALILIAGLIWSTQGLIIRNIYDSGAWTVLFWRSAGMFVVILAWIWFTSKGQLWHEFRAAGLAGIVGAIGLVLAFAGAIYSLQATTVAAHTSNTTVRLTILAVSPATLSPRRPAVEGP